MWFERLTGFKESNPESVREALTFADEKLHSLINGSSWKCGQLEVIALSELRERSDSCRQNGKTTVDQVVADIQDLHKDLKNEDALFQVASQFNLLEMISPASTPEQGVGIYENDPTQGPACAIAAGAGTIYRNYFASVNGQIGQSESNQINCLEAIGKALDNSDGRLWEMRNGYALASESGLFEINERLHRLNQGSIDSLRGKLKIGLHWHTQVTLGACEHTVSQAYCSALPVSYTDIDPKLWKPFATLILEAAYEATLCAARLNTMRTGNPNVYLTLLGGGAFGNDIEWILQAIRRAVSLHKNSGLNIQIVSYRWPNPKVAELVGI